MDVQEYNISGIIFKIILNSKKYKINDLFDEPQPFNLYINYKITKCNKKSENEKIIINHGKKTKVEIHNDVLIITANIHELVKKDYNHQFSLFGNKGIIQKYILHVLEKKYNIMVLHACSLISKNNDIIIGLGGSGSGKSVLINVALQNGWKLLSTEQTLINEKMEIIKGNIYDNVSPLSSELIEKKLPKASIIQNKKLIEPLGEKIFTDMSLYEANEDKIKIDFSKLTIINVDFNGKRENVIDIEDQDYLLRLLQLSASEKISFPGIIRNELVDFPYIGNAIIRQKIINKLIKGNCQKIILSNGFLGFTYFLNNYYRRDENDK